LVGIVVIHCGDYSIIKTAMATVINNPSETQGTGTGVVIGILVVLLLAILFLVFGLPYLRDGGTAQPSTSASLNVQLPTGGGDTSGGGGQ
jgi:hypothetical protein